LLVLGAAGGVGLTAVEIGKAMVARVIAAAGGREKLAVARSRGADELIDYKRESIQSRSSIARSHSIRPGVSLRPASFPRRLPVPPRSLLLIPTARERPN
jgi:threonine dehydrogenase-like Zn-dependent dehydrogenase